MYAYCNNNPVNLIDPTGISLGFTFKIGLGAEVSVGKKPALSASMGVGGGLEFIVD